MFVFSICILGTMCSVCLICMCVKCAYLCGVYTLCAMYSMHMVHMVSYFLYGVQYVYLGIVRVIFLFVLCFYILFRANWLKNLELS